jgi:hypothetical protein
MFCSKNYDCVGEGASGSRVCGRSSIRLGKQFTSVQGQLERRSQLSRESKICKRLDQVSRH